MDRKHNFNHMGSSKKSILIINASLSGSKGNTARILSVASKSLSKRFSVKTVSLLDSSYSKIRSEIKKSSGIIVGTGTHWESWSSRLQKFLEDATPDEGSDVWMGKPCAIVVTMHSFGGDGVSSRLMSVLNCLGAYVPPMCRMVYSFVGQESMKNKKGGLLDDIWCKEDVALVCHNLSEAVSGSSAWESWKVDRKNTNKVWVE